MATSSIYNEIKIKDKKSATRFLHALEESIRNKGKEVVLSRPLEELYGADINKLFEDEE